MDKYKELTSKGKIEYIKALESIGWFDFSNNTKHVIQERINNVKENIEFMFCLYDLLVYTVSYEEEESYRDLLEQIIKIIKLHGCKLKVKYLVKKGDFEMGIDEIGIMEMEIVVKNNVYKYSVNLSEIAGWFDENIIDEYINNNLFVGEKINKKIIPLPYSEQTDPYVFMPYDIFEKAINIGIIPENENYFMK
jgi:hypothetical protein